MTYIANPFRDLAQVPAEKRGEFTHLVMDPAAGKVPGTNDPAKFAIPKATNSLFGLMEYWYFAAFCFADTMLSKNPMTAASLILIRQ